MLSCFVASCHVATRLSQGGYSFKSKAFTRLWPGSDNPASDTLIATTLSQGCHNHAAILVFLYKNGMTELHKAGLSLFFPVYLIIIIGFLGILSNLFIESF